MTNVPITGEIIKVMSEEDFEKILKTSDVPILVDFWAAWCGPCLMQNPVLNDLAKVIQDKGIVVNVDVEKLRTLRDKFNVIGIPTLILFRDGKEVKRHEGFQPLNVLKEDFSTGSNPENRYPDSA